MKTINKTMLIVGVIVAIAIIGFLTYNYWPSPQEGISVHAVYDKDGNEIKPSKIVEQTAFSIPAESVIYYGAYSVAFDVTVTNAETEFLLDFLIETADPVEFYNAFSIKTMSLAAGGTDVWTSNPILLEDFVIVGVDNPVDFYIKVKGSSPIGARQDNWQEWSLATIISEDPLADFSITIDRNVG